MADTSVLSVPIAQLRRLIRGRKISSVELTKLSLEALETRGRAFNAVAELTPGIALQQAEQADRELQEGTVRGPLHGVPYGAKDVFATNCIPARWGSPTHRDQVFDYDATVVERLRQAGAVLVAKLSMIELAGAGGFESPAASLDGPCRNPYDLMRWAGGSSSGSGAAVGGGLVGFAIGADAMGSITMPSAFCNVSGLRPTYGRVPRYGAMAVAPTMDVIGPMARSAEDCGLVLAAIAGDDSRDPDCARSRFRFRPRTLARQRFRLGLLPADYEANNAPTAKRRFAAAMDVFHRLGHTSGPATLPDLPYKPAAFTIMNTEASATFETLIRSSKLEELLDKSQQAGLLSGLAVPPVDYLDAMHIRTTAAPVAVRIFEQFDVLVAPTFLHGAPLADRPLGETWVGMGGNEGPAHLLGWPSLSIPMGPDDDGLPLGMELIGPPAAEMVLLALAMGFQRESGWHRRKPPAPMP
jgi:aspartyl-tRNA(Asn)/glutamyl-tRNA(Gln) amidotransferase subunit A